jgi:hypothetical protein
MFWITESQANPKHVAALQLLDIPEDAERAVARFVFNDEVDLTSGFYGYALKGLTVLGLIWLVSLILKNFF